MNTKIFNNPKFGKVRIITDDGKTLFCGSDVAKALGYSNPRDTINRHCRCVVKRDTPHPQSPEKQIEMTFIPEGDVYRLAAKSELPGADEFERWIFDEILPTLRKTGTYSMQAIPSADPSNWHKAAAAANAADRALKIQGQTALKRALQTRNILAAAGVPLIPDFIKEDPQLSLFDATPSSIQINNVERLTLTSQQHSPTT